jgi:hypothetical protein
MFRFFQKIIVEVPFEFPLTNEKLHLLFLDGFYRHGRGKSWIDREMRILWRERQGCWIFTRLGRFC